MTDDQYSSGAAIHPAIAERLAAVAEKASRAYGVGKKALEITDDMRELLAELCGRSGKNGEIGRMKRDIENNEERSRANEAAIASVIAERKHERRLYLAWSALGAASGGGTVLGILKAWNALMGG